MSNPNSPIAIGALGGSGTRVIAQLLLDAGFYLGSERNRANDNLWFTLLFNRRNALLDSDDAFNLTVDLFYRRMRGDTAFDAFELEFLHRIATEERSQHGRDLLQGWLESFLDPSTAAPQPSTMPVDRSTPWGWKVPPTHVFLRRLLARDPALKYIHVVRHGLDMAFHRNKNQLTTWGPVFLNRDVQKVPADALAYWRAVDQRVQQTAAVFPGRVLDVRYEDFCRSPTDEAARILAFCGTAMPHDRLAQFASAVSTPPSTGHFRAHDLSQLDPADIDYVASRGMDIE